MVGIIRNPSDLGNPGAPAYVTFASNASIYLTGAFYHRFAGSVGNFSGLSFHLKRGPAALPAFSAEVRLLAGPQAQLELGSDDATQAAWIQDFIVTWRGLPGAGPAFIYTTRDRNTGNGNAQDNYGVYRTDWSPKPAADVIRGLA